MALVFMVTWFRFPAAPIVEEIVSSIFTDTIQQAQLLFCSSHSVNKSLNLFLKLISVVHYYYNCLSKVVTKYVCSVPVLLLRSSCC